MGSNPAYGSTSVSSCTYAVGSVSTGMAAIAASKSLPARPDNSKYLAADLPERLPLFAQSM